MCLETSEFIKIDNFEEVIEQAKKIINQSPKEYTINFSLKTEFHINLTKEPQLLDVQDLARNFQEYERPDTLYINHGEYIKSDGVEHVINELKNKHTGNRAIISLISQDHIFKSGDNPIPSFMVLQFSLEDKDLFVTTYFRALEVAKFLRINLEEIRLIINKIYQSMQTIKLVKLNIFAFRAYINQDINPLQRPKIELLPERRILKLMENKPEEIANLLEDKISHSTVVENNSLKIMNDIVNDSECNQNIHKCFKEACFKNFLSQCLKSSNELIKLRESASHGDNIDNLNQQYLHVLSKLIKEIQEKCH